MSINLIQRLRRFKGCDRGVTAVEFAFTLPVVLFFIMGVMEFSTMFMAQNMLESAINDAARTGKTGYVEAGSSREETILARVRTRVERWMDPSQITLETQVYKALNQINQPEAYTDRNHNGQYDPGESFTDSNANGHWDADMGAEGQGVDGETVVYTISYPWHVMTPILAQILADDGVVNLSSRLVVKNEPYGEDS